MTDLKATTIRVQESKLKQLNMIVEDLNKNRQVGDLTSASGVFRNLLDDFIENHKDSLDEDIIKIRIDTRKLPTNIHKWLVLEAYRLYMEFNYMTKDDDTVNEDEEMVRVGMALRQLYSNLEEVYPAFIKMSEYKKIEEEVQQKYDKR